jgi:hypothetical protein
MQTTLEIPDELYREAEVKAARQNRALQDLVNEGLSMVVGAAPQLLTRPSYRMSEAPVTIREGNLLPVLSNDAMAELLDSEGERS